jgi:hypothetical protein
VRGVKADVNNSCTAKSGAAARRLYHKSLKAATAEKITKNIFDFF